MKTKFKMKIKTKIKTKIKMRKKEKETEKQCVAFARQIGIIGVKMENTGHKGIPDRLFIAKNIMFFVEFKTKNGIVSKEQIYWRNVLTERNIKVYICRSLEQFKEILITFELL